MSRYPDDVAAALLRGIGAYIRELPPQELPAKLRRYRSFRPQALTSHRDTLLGVLDDDVTRARMGHWLDNDKTPLSKDDARILRLATARDDGWEAELQASSKPPPRRKRSSPTDDSKLEAEREKARRSKEELKRAREELRSAERTSAARIADLEATVRDLEQRLANAERESAKARAEMATAIDRAERGERKAKRALEKAEAQRDGARKEVKELRRELARSASEAKALTPARPRAVEKKRTSSSKKRTPLRVPKGRLGDDPATLERWLARDDVMLLIDGYNVAKADGGYEDLQLEAQRERLVDAVFTVAKMTNTETIVVFDAQRVPGRRTRRSRRPVVVEWSKPGQIADDYIVERLEELPQAPVVLVTNDKELQERGRALDATIATSQQLLALLR